MPGQNFKNVHWPRFFKFTLSVKADDGPGPGTELSSVKQYE